MTRFVVAAFALAGCYTSSTTTSSTTAPPEEERAVTKKPPRRPPAKASSGCDEVSCVLDNYTGNCCYRYRKPRNAAAPQPALPTQLERGHIQTAIAAVRPQITACANIGVKGTVKVSVKVAPDGSIAHLAALSSPDPSLEACVLAAIGSVVFPATDNGGSFAYPFVF